MSALESGGVGVDDRFGRKPDDRGRPVLAESGPAAFGAAGSGSGP